MTDVSSIVATRRVWFRVSTATVHVALNMGVTAGWFVHGGNEEREERMNILSRA